MLHRVVISDVNCSIFLALGGENCSVNGNIQEEVSKTELVDVKDVIKLRAKKKKGESDAIKLALTEAKNKAKKKNKRDKSKFNQAPTR